MLAFATISSGQGLLKRMKASGLKDPRPPLVVTDTSKVVLVVKSIIDKLYFKTNREKIQVVQEAVGEWLLFLEPGNHILTFSAPDFQSLIKYISIPKEARCKEIEIMPVVKPTPQKKQSFRRPYTQRRSYPKLPRIPISTKYGEFRFRLHIMDDADGKGNINKIRGFDFIFESPTKLGFGFIMGDKFTLIQMDYGKWNYVSSMNLGLQFKLFGFRSYATSSIYAIDWTKKDTDKSISYIFNIFGYNYGVEFSIYLSKSWGISICYENSVFNGQLANIGYKGFGIKDNKYSTIIVGFSGIKLK